jgi:hypothetical protein
VRAASASSTAMSIDVPTRENNPQDETVSHDMAVDTAPKGSTDGGDEIRADAQKSEPPQRSPPPPSPPSHTVTPAPLPSTTDTHNAVGGSSGVNETEVEIDLDVSSEQAVVYATGTQLTVNSPRPPSQPTSPVAHTQQQQQQQQQRSADITFVPLPHLIEVGGECGVWYVTERQNVVLMSPQECADARERSVRDREDSAGGLRLCYGDTPLCMSNEAVPPYVTEDNVTRVGSIDGVAAAHGMCSLCVCMCERERESE